jgi:hypothetical protein
MESESQRNYQFLTYEVSQKYFADTDFALRQGKHIQDIDEERRIFRYLTEYYEELSLYYLDLFNVYLRKEFVDTDSYFYLDFPEENKGRFRYERSWELRDKYLIFGILLLSLYYDKFFEKKESSWEELEQIISEGENKEKWMRLLFPEVRASQTITEWSNLKRTVKNALDDFEHLRWIRWSDKEEIVFEILPAIHRLAKLYKREIELLSKPQ